MNKRCNRCGARKDETHFELSSLAKDGYRATCNECLAKPEPKATVKAGTINKFAGTYKPEKNLYCREQDNKSIKSHGTPC
jgi:hypothetical protein